MLKNILILISSFLLLQIAKATSPDTLRTYLKNSGQKVATKDSADFYRIIFSPDSNIDKDLYRVFDYYPNRKPKMMGTTMTNDSHLALGGPCINYFANGKRMSIAQYKNGRLTNSITTYYPNGKLYNILKIEDSNSGLYNGFYYRDSQANNMGYKCGVIELRDSTGNLLAENGSGHVIVFDENFKRITLEGYLTNDKRAGEWRGIIADTARYVCIFHKDELKSGESFTASGKHYTFKKIRVEAQFSDGDDELYRFCSKTFTISRICKKTQGNG